MLPSFTGFYLVLLGFTGFLLDFIQFDWVLLGFWRVVRSRTQRPRFRAAAVVNEL